MALACQLGSENQQDTGNNDLFRASADVPLPPPTIYNIMKLFTIMKKLLKICLILTLTINLIVACSETTVVDNCIVSQEDQTGVYEMTTSEVAGNCGNLGSLQVKIDEGSVVIDERFGCELREDDWNINICATESIFYCDDGEWIMKLNWTVKSATEDSEQLFGDLSAVMQRFSVAYSCESQYKFEAVRSGDL